MRILIDILHPAHVHVFKHFRAEMIAGGHEVRVTSRDKDVTVDLLESYGIPHKVISKQGKGLGLGIELAIRTTRLLRLARRWKPDVMTGIMGPSIALAGRVLGIPSVVLYDTEIATTTNSWVYPLASAVITPSSYKGKVRGNHFVYDGSHELAYLHPARFRPSPGAIEAFGLAPDEPFVIVRLVSWSASHDRKLSGLTLKQQRKLVDRLADLGRVLISSEEALPIDLEPLRLNGPLHFIHDLIAQATAFVGESATMASEAATLGTPTFYIAAKSRGYIDELHDAGLLRRYTLDQFDGLMSDLAAMPEPEPELHERWIESKVDVTTWLVRWFEDRYGAA